MAELAKEPPEGPEVARQLTQAWEDISEATFGLLFYVQPENVSEAGWAVVFSSDESGAVKDAMAPLIEHRRRRAGGGQVKVLDYRSGEGWSEWLRRHGTAPGNVDPDRVPYYVLLVGSPGRIPFAFQYLLDVEYAVGRLHFDDADGYRQYVTGLIDYEEAGAAPRDRAAAFFGTRHPLDRATQLSADLLVRPLAESFQPGGQFGAVASGYQIHPQVLEESATKAALAEILAGTGRLGRPAFLFSATHGMGGWPPGHPDQRARTALKKGFARAPVVGVLGAMVPVAMAGWWARLARQAGGLAGAGFLAPVMLMWPVVPSRFGRGRARGPRAGPS